MSLGRVLICDPMCVLPFGHNVPAMGYFRQLIQNNTKDVYAVCCKELSADIAKAKCLTPFFRFYYSRYFPNVRTESTIKTSPSPGWFIDDEERMATEDALALLREFGIGAEDTLFHPHLDFYGAVGLLNALEKWPRDRRPRLLLRFIGVMENASHTYRDPLEELIGRLRLAMEDGIEMSFSAETPLYADVLAEKLESIVTVTAYPEMSKPIPMREHGPFVFYCAGSARHDKGFMHLPEIFSAVRRRDPEMTIRFITQMLPAADLKHSVTTARNLYALPGVEVQASAISSEEMIAAYERSHAVLLPYDAATYRYRGSAVLMEAAFHGRPAITLEGTAFAGIARHYNLGVVVDSVPAMVDAIFEMAGTRRSVLAGRAAQARHRFHLDNTAAFQSWLKI